MANVGLLLSDLTLSIMSFIAICLLFVNFADVRRDDFMTATLSNFSGLGTCTSTPTPGDISSADVLNAHWNCEGAGGDKHRELSNLLAAATHSIYYAHRTTNLTAHTPALNVILAAAVGRTHGAVGAPQSRGILEALQGVVVPASCDAIYNSTTPGMPPLPVVPAVTCSDMPIESSEDVWSDKLQTLYTHCVHQFSFGASGPAPGSFWVPVYGEKAGPTYAPTWHSVDAQSYSSATNARLFLGQRFGAAAWAYSVLMLSLGFCFLDGVLILISDGTREARDPPDWRTKRRLDATINSKRDRRWVLLLTLFIVSIVSLLYFLWVPFRMGRRLGRPLCEAGAASSGWKPDTGSAGVEIYCIVCLGVGIVLPWVRDCCNRDKGASKVKSDDKTSAVVQRGGSMVDARPRAEKPYKTTVFQLATYTAVRTSMASLGGILLASAFAISGSVFGSAWRDAVVESQSSEQDIVFLADYAWTTAMDSLYAMLSVGMIMAVILARWLMLGWGICSEVCVPVLVWIGAGVLAAAFMFLAIGTEAFTEESPSCEIFDGGFAERSCLLKWVCLVTGASITLLALLWAMQLAVADLCLRGGRSDRFGDAGPKREGAIPLVPVGRDPTPTYDEERRREERSWA